MSRLKELREDRMLTVRELSKLSGVSEDTITKIENGHRKGRGVTLRKLAKALEVDPRQLSLKHSAQSIEAKGAATETPSGSSSGSNRAVAVPLTTDTQDTDAFITTLSRVDETIAHIEPVVASLGVERQILRNLIPSQLKVLEVVVFGGSLDASAVAELLPCGLSTANRNLTVLGEHDLVSTNEAGESQATWRGRELIGSLAKGGLRFGEALKHIVTLAEAYESLAALDLHKAVEEDERWHVFQRERSERQVAIERLIRALLNLATPTPPNGAQAVTVQKAMHPYIDMYSEDSQENESGNLWQLSRSERDS